MRTIPEKTMAIEFKPIIHCGLLGTSATLGDRAVEIVRAFDGVLLLFRAVGGQPVKGVIESMRWEDAEEIAREFLESNGPVEVWPVATNIGERTDDPIERIRRESCQNDI